MIKNDSLVIWAGIVDQTWLDHSKLRKNLNCANYFDFMGLIFFVWCKHKYTLSKGKCVFMLGYVFPRVSKLTRKFFNPEKFAGKTIMEWPPSSPCLNPKDYLVFCEDEIMKVANIISAKQIYGNQLKLPCRKLNLLK